MKESNSVESALQSHWINTSNGLPQGPGFEHLLFLINISDTDEGVNSQEVT